MLNLTSLKCASRCLQNCTTIFFYSKNNQIYSQNMKYLKYSTSAGRTWKILFFGNDSFSLQSIKSLNTAYRKKELLQRLEIVSSDKDTQIAKYAEKQNIALHLWPPQIHENEFDIGIIVSFGHLIPSRTINLFPLGMINVHGSLLPKWRGAAPIAYSLMNGDTRTGISIFKIMPKKFDAGAIIAKQEIEIHPEETHVELEKRMSIEGANLLMKVVTKLPDILIEAESQPEEGVTFAPKITKKLSFINWNTMTAKNVYDLQRGLNGIQPLRTYYNNEVIKLRNIKAIPENENINHKNYIKEKVPGIIMFNKKNKTLYASCKGNSWITIDEVIFPSSKPKSAIQFSTGYILKDKSKDHIFYYK